jgi:tRNA G26 N,N-dimethylase Trm1
MSMHEWAVRILVRYCQLIGAQYDKALLPVLCYKKDHYVRLYLQCKKSKELASQIVREHHYVYIHQNSGEVSLVAKKNYFKAGPMYLGALVDSSTFDEKKFRSHITDGWVDRLFSAGKNSVGYYTVPQLCSLHKVSKQPSVESVLKCLRSKKYFAYESLNFVESIKSNCSYKQFVSALKEISKASVKLRKK